VRVVENTMNGQNKYKEVEEREPVFEGLRNKFTSNAEQPAKCISGFFETMSLSEGFLKELPGNTLRRGLITVLGGGPFGFAAALHLKAKGCRVKIVDKDGARCEKLRELEVDGFEVAETLDYNERVILSCTGNGAIGGAEDAHDYPLENFKDGRTVYIGCCTSSDRELGGELADQHGMEDVIRVGVEKKKFFVLMGGKSVNFSNKLPYSEQGCPTPFMCINQASLLSCLLPEDERSQAQKTILKMACEKLKVHEKIKEVIESAFPQDPDRLTYALRLLFRQNQKHIAFADELEHRMSSSVEDDEEDEEAGEPKRKKRRIVENE